jgi:UDP-glucose 4-epimerase
MVDGYLELDAQGKSRSRAILVTGGAGYIGSHCCLELLEAGYEVVALDNLCNSSRESLRRVEQITGKSLHFEEVDLLDERATGRVVGSHDFEAVIHFAGLKADPTSLPVREDSATRPNNPYGRTKLMIEQILRDAAAAEIAMRVILLRYFNPVGAHASGRIGEDPRGVPNNLMPYIMQVAVGRRPSLRIFGDDYPTRDGTGVRDYVHVVDLVRGHIAALRKLDQMTGCTAYNLGTGTGYSVLEMLEAVRKATSREIPCEVVARREGDVAECYADPSRSESELGWRAERGLDAMAEDAWRWQLQNPNGFMS